MLDVESFSALLTDSYQHCWLVAAAITGDRVEADDIVQEASLIALRKRNEFVVGTSFTAWMAQIVRLTALNHVKKAVRRGNIATDPAMIDRVAAARATTASDEQLAVSDEGRLSEHQSDFDDDVLLALREISDDARACFLLRVVRRLSYSEIAETLHIPEGTAMSHVFRAKHTLRERLKQRPQSGVPLAKQQKT